MFTPLAQAVIATNIVFVVVSGVIVYLRVTVRKQKAPPLRADDYLIVAAWVKDLGQYSGPLLNVRVGFLCSSRHHKHRGRTHWWLRDTVRIVE